MESALAAAVVMSLRQNHVPAVQMSARPPPGAFILQLDITRLQAGSAWQRIVVGFGLGQSSLDLDAHLLVAGAHHPLLSFQVHATSGSEPGVPTALIGMANGAYVVPLLQGGFSTFHLGGLGSDQDVAGAAQAVLLGLNTYFRRLGWDDWSSAPGTLLGQPTYTLAPPTPLHPGTQTPP